MPANNLKAYLKPKSKKSSGGSKKTKTSKPTSFRKSGTGEVREYNDHV
jgi:hypothetical protein